MHGVSFSMIACVLADDLPIRVEDQRRPADLPRLITHPADSGVVFACSPEAGSAGVYPGMSVYQAREIVSHALVWAPDERAYQVAHASLEGALQPFSARIETIELGELLLDVTLAGGEAGEVAALGATLAAAAQAASGLGVRVGVGTGRLVAQQAARCAPPGGVMAVPAGGEARFLAPLPLVVLPHQAGELRRRLLLANVYTLGDLAARSKEAALRQFGPAIAGAYDLARGRDSRPVNPHAPPPCLELSLPLASPVIERAALLATALQAGAQLTHRLRVVSAALEALKLVLDHADGTRSEIGQLVRRPELDDTQLRRLVVVLLGRLTVSVPVTAMALRVYPRRLPPPKPAMAARLEPERTHSLDRARDALVRLVDRLGPPMPLRVRVSLDGRGLPCGFEMAGRRRVVLTVTDHWREERRWWDRRRLHRDYYRVVVSDGSARVLFQDLTHGEWYLGRPGPLL